MARVSHAIVVGLMLAGVAQGVAARQLFEGTFATEGTTGSAGASSATKFADFFTDAGFQSVIGAYTPNSAATADVSLRGVPATLSYAANSPVLRLQIPSIGLDRSFNGATRDESQDLALRWLQGEGSSDLSRFLQQAVASTPIDPVAGNPNSLMSQMGAADFAVGTGGARLGTGLQQGSTGSRFGLGARFGSYSASGWDTTAWTLPLNYSYGFENGTTLILDSPFTVVETAGAQSYSGSLGAGLTVPLRLGLPDWVNWSLTPMARFGAVGSVELGAVGGMWSVSVTSNLDFRLADRTTLTVGNMVGHLQTVPITIQDYNISYNLKNTIFRNGLVLTQGIGEIAGRPVSASVFAVGTRFTGDALYVNSYQEFGAYLTFGEPVQVAGMRVPLRLGFTYTTGDNGYSGFAVNVGISF